mmetsp:Transcript_14322/g.23838  ORF Transcript_14322/g.23838 Transcript_14322/m.23838 type:complete len:212 (+) Transcript_14322:799-1434(+)
MCRRPRDSSLMSRRKESALFLVAGRSAPVDWLKPNLVAEETERHIEPVLHCFRQHCCSSLAARNDSPVGCMRYCSWLHGTHASRGMRERLGYHLTLTVLAQTTPKGEDDPHPKTPCASEEVEGKTSASRHLTACSCSPQSWVEQAAPSADSICCAQRRRYVRAVYSQCAASARHNWPPVGQSVRPHSCPIPCVDLRVHAGRIEGPCTRVLS